jgi:hypothetical protein
MKQFPRVSPALFLRWVSLSLGTCNLLIRKKAVCLKFVSFFKGEVNAIGFHFLSKNSFLSYGHVLWFQMNLVILRTYQWLSRLQVKRNMSLLLFRMWDPFWCQNIIFSILSVYSILTLSGFFHLEARMEYLCLRTGKYRIISSYRI